MGFRRELATAVPENRVRFVGHPEHVHDVPHLIHMVMGRGTLTVDGERIALEPRNSVWLAAGVSHALSLYEHSIALGPLLDPRTSPAERMRRLGVVPAITDLMLARLAAQPHTEQQRALFTDSLDEILTTLDTDRFAAPMPVHPTVAQIAESAIDSPATLSALCDRMGMSTRQAQRIFATETGMSFHRWRTRRRLNRALRSLRSGSTAESAARAAGFATRSSLLRALSRESGTPLDTLRANPLACLPTPPERPAIAERNTGPSAQLQTTAMTVRDPARAAW